tara:strand:+ start:1926 stop:2330 length:405 start_codon:yes stop_codon:yes gene_type:complete
MNESFFQKSEIPSFEGNSGSLSAIEFNNLPFEVKRIFYITKVPKGFERGFHAHKNTQQFLVCLQGSCDVYLEYKKESEIIKLEKNSEGILIGKEWHIMKNFSDDCILLVLANSHYDEKDYIRNYEDFLKYSNEN